RRASGAGRPCLTGVNAIEILESRTLLSASSTFSSPVSYNVGSAPSPSVPNVSQDGVTYGDFNGDGKADLAVVHSANSTVNILINKGNGTFNPAVSYPTGSTNTVWVRVADVNGDGKRDLVLLGSHNNAGSVGILIGNGNGTFKPVVTYEAGGVDSDGIASGVFNCIVKTVLAS